MVKIQNRELFAIYYNSMKGWHRFFFFEISGKILSPFKVYSFVICIQVFIRDVTTYYYGGVKAKNLFLYNFPAFG